MPGLERARHLFGGAGGWRALRYLDEATYPNKSMWGKDLTMGKDHPVVWWHCVGKGRVLYSAMGHQASAYDEPEYRKLLMGATEWALGLDGPGCGASTGPATVGPKP